MLLALCRLCDAQAGIIFRSYIVRPTVSKSCTIEQVPLLFMIHSFYAFLLFHLLTYTRTRSHWLIMLIASLPSFALFRLFSISSSSLCFFFLVHFISFHFLSNHGLLPLNEQWKDNLNEKNSTNPYLPIIYFYCLQCVYSIQFTIRIKMAQAKGLNSTIKLSVCLQTRRLLPCCCSGSKNRLCQCEKF